MQENGTNRSWLLNGRDGRDEVRTVDRQSDVEALLYYRDQLVAELETVERHIATITQKGS